MSNVKRSISLPYGMTFLPPLPHPLATALVSSLWSKCPNLDLLCCQDRVGLAHEQALYVLIKRKVQVNVKRQNYQTFVNVYLCLQIDLLVYIFFLEFFCKYLICFKVFSFYVVFRMGYSCSNNSVVIFQKYLEIKIYKISYSSALR